MLAGGHHRSRIVAPLARVPPRAINPRRLTRLTILTPQITSPRLTIRPMS
jgi:hypothetical protein